MGAGYISKDTINAINNTSDIVSVVSDYTKLERRGGNDYWGCCPFHGEKTASFHVDSDKKFYYCFGCHASGNVVKFVMEMEKISYAEALTSLAKKFGIPVRYEEGYSQSPDYQQEENKKNQMIDLYDRTASMFHYLLTETEQGKKALDYVVKRGLTKETVEKFRLGYAPADRYWLKKFLKSKNYSDEFLKESGLFSSNYPDISFFADRLMFPIFNKKGQVVAFGGRVLPPANEKERKYLNSSDLPQFKKKETLFGFNFAKSSIREQKKIIFCEGNMDVIAYHQCGLTYAVATLGTAMTEQHIKMIQGFVADGEVYLSFDSDEAGQKATKRAVLMLRKFGLTVKIIQLKGGKDPAEIMLKYGAENLTAQVNNAILDSDYFLLRLGEAYPIETPEGKQKAALEFFEYVDALQSEIQKELCLEQLTQAFNLKPEAVKRDFINRNQARERVNIRQENNKQEEVKQIKLDAELRGLIAVTADLDQFKILRSNLSENDFKNPTAKSLYRILEECLNENVFSIPGILTHCQDEALSRLIAQVISSGVYQSENVSIIINDTIKYVRKNNLDEQRNKLLQRIKNFRIITEEDKNQFNALLAEKMELDKQVQILTK
ncbi:MAG: DNA primase [Treponema sp.]|nr:DNA primase [Treponema sp.]